MKLTYVLLILTCLCIAAFFLGYPFYVIRPFRHQGVTELAVALAVLRVRPAVMVACVAVASFAALRYWHMQPSRLRRWASAAGVLLICVAAALSRINIYEKMFHPIGQPAFESVAQTKLAADEKVIAVHIAGTARAYPIRIISYHHVVNDTVAGVPIVATY